MAHSKSLVDTTAVPEDDLGIFSGFSFIEEDTKEELFSDFNLIEGLPQEDEDIIEKKSFFFPPNNASFAFRPFRELLVRSSKKKIKTLTYILILYCFI